MTPSSIRKHRANSAGDAGVTSAVLGPFGVADYTGAVNAFDVRLARALQRPPCTLEGHVVVSSPAV